MPIPAGMPMPMPCMTWGTKWECGMGGRAKFEALDPGGIRPTGGGRRSSPWSPGAPPNPSSAPWYPPLIGGNPC